MPTPPEFERTDHYTELEELRHAKELLLTVTKMAVAALNTAPRFSVPSVQFDSYEIASICDRAIKDVEK